MKDTSAVKEDTTPQLTDFLLKKDNSLIEFLLQHNVIQSEKFSDPGMALLRQQYRGDHRTEILACKCMDGRLHLPIMTETPLGIIQPFRNIGGQFDLGWPYFGLLMKEWVDYAMSRGRDCIALITYHFSASDYHLGCKGFNYDTERAKDAAQKLVSRFEYVFGAGHQTVYPILIGIETDKDVLILHNKERSIKLSDFDVNEPEKLRQEVMYLYPDMKTKMLDDLFPLLLGNLRHTKEISEHPTNVKSINHCEQILGIGRGFDWLHLRNKALIVGPFSFDLVDPIAKAAGILMSNLKEGRISKDEGVALISSAVHREDKRVEQHLAEEKAKSLAELAFHTIRTHVPDLLPYLSVLVGTVDLNNRKFTRIIYK